MIKKMRIAFVIGAGLLLTGSFFSSCYYDNVEELYGTYVCDTSSVTYSGTILPILESECLTCHSATSADGLGGGNNLEGYDNVMGFVVANDPNNSTLYKSIAWLAGASHMPKGSAQLSDCDIAKVRVWINSSAPNN